MLIQKEIEDGTEQLNFTPFKVRISGARLGDVGSEEW